ncbi:MAG: hypothetical protein QW569_05160 [Candidatus Bathyarchaeia archaeon]
MKDVEEDKLSVVHLHIARMAPMKGWVRGWAADRMSPSSMGV